MKTKTPIIAAVVLAIAGPVAAQTTTVTTSPTPAAKATTSVTASTDLNLRAGPASNAEIVGVIGAGDAVDLQGCLDASNWCQVNYDGMSGWAYGDYLQTKVEEKVVAVYPNREQLNVTTVTRDEDGSDAGSAGVVGAAGAAVGALIGGPAAIAAGAVAGAVSGAAANPDPETVTYVERNPVEPVYLTGETVVGAGIPGEVTLQPIPQSKQYSYLYLNGQPVIVETESRQIVQIVR